MLRKSSGGRGIRFVTPALLALTLLLGLLTGVAQATTRVVTTNANSGPGSLRAAVSQSAAGDVVQLPARADHYQVTSEIPITVPLSIQGAGPSSSVIDGGGHTRVLHITSAVPTASTVTLQGLTVTGGNTTSVPGGGGILDDSGALALIDAAVTGSTATVDLGTAEAGGGGGIYNAGGDTTLPRSLITGDHADVTSAARTSRSTQNCCHGGGGVYQEKGSITVTNSVLSDNTAVIHGSDTGTDNDTCCGGGGAIYENNGAAVVTITGSTLDSNTATILGGNCCHGGGALYFDANSNNSAAQDLVINSSHLDHNTTTVTTQLVGQGCCSGGGAIATFGSMQATASTFDFNTASLTNQECCNGGGALNFDSGSQPITLDHSDVSGNAFHLTTAGQPGRPTDTCCNGGGAVQLDVNGPVFSVIGSLISGNSAQMSGVVESGGGAVYEDTGGSYRANYSNSTLSGNTTDAAVAVGDPAQGGGAVYELGSSGSSPSIDTFTNSTAAGNRAPAGSGGAILGAGGDTHSVNSIIAGNQAPTGPNCTAVRTNLNSLPGTFSSGGHNVENTDSCGLHAAGDLINTDPKLGPLQLNGGPFATMALLDGSPAINAADNSVCPASDMRGITRPQPAGGTCDIGAYEATGPNASTGAATFVTSQGATLNGTVNAQNLTTTVHFDYGLSTAYGHSTPTQTVSGAYGDKPIAAALTGLTKLTGYHYRIVATNMLGTVIGNDATFSTTAGPGRIALFGHLGFVSPRGVAGVFVGCFGNPCAGKLTISTGATTIALRKNFMVAGNDGGIVHVRLDASGRSALAAAKHQHLSVTVAVADSSGHSVSTSFSLVRFSTAAVAAAARAGAAAYGHTGFVSPAGTAGVFVGCFATTTCTGTVALSGGQSAGAYRLRPGTGALVSVKLTKSTHQTLLRRGKINAQLTLSDTTTHTRQQRTVSLVTYQ